jgi:predicted dehydrogenase
MNKLDSNLTSRRQFLKTSSAAITGTLAGPLILTSKTRAASPGDTVKVGLIGCGGRGSGAAKNALSADSSVVLTAIGDAFPDRLERGLNNLKADKEVGEKVKVAADNAFSGLDAYEKVINSGVDVVILATPPGFRPLHLKAAVDAGKHVFCEKPMATDAPGVRSILESARRAKEKNLALVAGFCYRYNPGVRALMQRVHEGAIGEIRALHTDYNTGLVGGAFPQKSGQSDSEWQIRNWWHFTWLSGDHIVEQAVHSIDKMAWAMKDEPPVKCHAIGGRAVPHGSGIGHIFDHFGVVYEYANGVRGFHFCRQQAGCFNQNHDYIMGNDGAAHIVRAIGGPFLIKGKNAWRYREESSKDMYQVEHDELFASIRSGKPINDGERMAKSTLLAIMGRMAAYTGLEITWEEALNSKETLMPEKLSFDTQVKLVVPPIAMPGRTKFS